MTTASIFKTKKIITGNWVAIMDHERHDRALHLSPYRTRCVRLGEIHEFLTCYKKTDNNLPINNVAYLGFGELNSGGVIEVGDVFYSEKQFIGTVLGFDETHFPNHYNIVLQSEVFSSGAVRGLECNKNFSILKVSN